MSISNREPKTVFANAFSSVTLSGVTQDLQSSAPLDVVLTRGKPRENRPLIVDTPGVITGPRPPKRLPSKLPSPGNMNLHLTLGKKIGRGRVGRVFEATIDLHRSSPELADMLMPPLVVKVSRRQDANKIAREAFYYDEMECLQGSVIPRYYGFFEATIPPNIEFTPWAHDKLTRSSHRYDASSDLSESEYDTDSNFEEDGSDLEEVDENGERYSDSDDDTPPMVVTPTKVSILIMERVGGRLPLGEMLPDGLREELDSMYLDLSKLGVDHVDIRYFNILYAPPPLPELPFLPSPLSQRVYNYRLVDFDNSYKSNRGPALWYGYHRCLLSRLLMNLPYGDIYEPWEM
ncbi:unnamed protein product [Somion occarium]|uniref:Protein kinase domain-containing protein n=1 Tax=Somion occarium TaxID=3059160 RepID=A0ABP1DEK0_9APHY